MYLELWKNIRQSVYNPAFYRELHAKPLSFSIKYFYALALVLTLIITAVLSFELIPSAHSFLNRLGPELSALYPAELIITIKDHQASVNVAEPYFIKMPAAVREKASQGGPENLLVIDTKGPVDQGVFKYYNTEALLTQDDIFVRDRTGIRIYSLESFPDTTITKKSVDRVLDRLAGLAAFIGPVIVIGVFVVFLAIFSAKLVYLFLAALLIWLIAKVKKTHLKYLGAYQIGVHAITLASLIFALSIVFAAPIRIPFFTTLLVLIVAAINLKPHAHAA